MNLERDAIKKTYDSVGRVGKATGSNLDINDSSRHEGHQSQAQGKSGEKHR